MDIKELKRNIESNTISDECIEQCPCPKDFMLNVMECIGKVEHGIDMTLDSRNLIDNAVKDLLNKRAEPTLPEFLIDLIDVQLELLKENRQEAEEFFQLSVVYRKSLNDILNRIKRIQHI